VSTQIVVEENITQFYTQSKKTFHIFQDTTFLQPKDCFILSLIL